MTLISQNITCNVYRVKGHVSFIGVEMIGKRMATDSVVGSIERRDLLADRAYKEILNAIFARKLSPGTTLSVPDLARQLAISRSPVREAIQRVVHEGLAVTEPHRGAVVASFGTAEVLNLYEIREVLEGLAARRAAERLDSSSKADLQKLVKEHREVLEQGKGFVMHMDLDMQFHRRIRELSGNAQLAELLLNLQGRVRLVMHSLWHNKNAPQRALEDHAVILAALCDGDPSEAESAARAHIARLRKTLVKTIESEAEHRVAGPEKGALQDDFGVRGKDGDE